MWYQYQDAYGNVQWAMLPQYAGYFTQFLELIKMLKGTVNKKWKPEQTADYQKYLTDVSDYINAYIVTGIVPDLNVFYEAMEAYGTTTNPVGQELYEIQIEYIQKV